MYKNMTDGVRDNEHESEVDTPKQNVDYSKTFHQIDKGNQQETIYIPGKQESRSHGWVVAQAVVYFFNMTLNNACNCKIYMILYEQEHQQHENWMDKLKPCVMNDAIEELTHYSLSGWWSLTYGREQRIIRLCKGI